MSPSSFRTWAIATFSFEDGITTLGFSTICALRMRVSISAIGSLMLIRKSPRGLGALRLPAGLDDARDVALERQIADLVAAEAELAEGATRPAGHAAAVA